MHPDLHLTLHHQVEHELAEVLGRRLAIAERRGATPSAPRRQPVAPDRTWLRRLVAAVAPTPTTACCPA